LQHVLFLSTIYPALGLHAPIALELHIVIYTKQWFKSAALCVFDLQTVQS